MDRGAWWVTVHRVAESDATTHTHIYCFLICCWVDLNQPSAHKFLCAVTFCIHTVFGAIFTSFDIFHIALDSLSQPNWARKLEHNGVPEKLSLLLTPIKTILQNFPSLVFLQFVFFYCWFTPNISSVSSVAQSCPTLCDPMNCSTPGLPVHHQLLEFTHIHVHRVSDAIQPSHPLSSPSPPAPNPSQHQSLFQWVNSLHQVAKVLEFQPQHQSFQWTPRTDLV